MEESHTAINTPVWHGTRWPCPATTWPDGCILARARADIGPLRSLRESRGDLERTIYAGRARLAVGVSAAEPVRRRSRCTIRRARHAWHVRRCVGDCESRGPRHPGTTSNERTRHVARVARHVANTRSRCGRLHIVADTVDAHRVVARCKSHEPFVPRSRRAGTNIHSCGGTQGACGCANEGWHRWLISADPSPFPTHGQCTAVRHRCSRWHGLCRCVGRRCVVVDSDIARGMHASRLSWPSRRHDKRAFLSQRPSHTVHIAGHASTDLLCIGRHEPSYTRRTYTSRDEQCDPWAWSRNSDRQLG